MCMPRKSIFVLHIVTSAEKRLRISHIAAAIYLAKWPPVIPPSFRVLSRGMNEKPGIRVVSEANHVEPLQSQQQPLCTSPPVICVGADGRFGAAYCAVLTNPEKARGPYHDACRDGRSWIEAADIEVPGGRGSRRIGTLKPVILSQQESDDGCLDPFGWCAGVLQLPLVRRRRQKMAVADGSLVVGSGGDDADRGLGEQQGSQGDR